MGDGLRSACEGPSLWADSFSDVIAVGQIAQKASERRSGSWAQPSSTQVILPVPGLTPDFRRNWVAKATRLAHGIHTVLSDNRRCAGLTRAGCQDRGSAALASRNAESTWRSALGAPVAIARLDQEGSLYPSCWPVNCMGPDAKVCAPPSASVRSRALPVTVEKPR